MYSGTLEDVVLTNDRKIDHVILSSPVQRYFMDLTSAPPSIANRTDLELTNDSVYASLFVNGADIENIYFVRSQPVARLAALRTIFSQFSAQSAPVEEPAPVLTYIHDV